MTSMDTLKAARSLKNKGFSTEQAEAIAEVINEVGRADLVTKSDLWQHTVAIIVANAAIMGLLLRVIR